MTIKRCTFIFHLRILNPPPISGFHVRHSLAVSFATTDCLPAFGHSHLPWKLHFQMAVVCDSAYLHCADSMYTFSLAFRRCTAARHRRTTQLEQASQMSH